MPLRLFILLNVLITLVTPLTGQNATHRIESFDASDGLPPGWSVVAGDWKTSEGKLQVRSMDSDSYITFGDPSWKNYQVEAEVTFIKVREPSRWISLLVRADEDGTTPWSQVPVRFDATRKNGVEFAVRTAPDQWSVRQVAAADAPCRLNQPRRLRVTVRETFVEAYLDDQKVLESHYCVDRRRGCVGLGASGCIASFDNVSVRLLPDDGDAVATPSGACETVAHRGFSAIAPENTLAAIDEAIRAGADGCEFDVYQCGDGTVVLMHDKTVDRTTDGTGRITELSLEQLRQLDAGSWKDKRFAGEPVPTLKQALERLRGTGCQPVIEVKMEGISRQVIDDVRALDMVDQVAVIAFSKTVVQEIRELEPKLTCAWLYGETIPGTPEQQADFLQSQARECNARILDLSYKILSPELVAELKTRRLGVWTWTVNEAAVMQALRRWGVDSITTDRPNLMTAESVGQ
ncbi:Glycerophosphoryl diester phosphodiesterase [Stieleria maiorica]|uniref:Glycerophosphoryl diester phosphodiesterase n=1 Tax=Stieleria maiorica TaxID=2795974 RepID=A0A5B9M8Z3_9BACT|nr:glycerophosphodiester phosphodiesterase family protein [Stieleria maiorica]QEF97671.1 Glycerophosphoryl diester phosphodiesterase [Stieleria maiorica]